MKVRKLSGMKNGWFLGDFEPSALKTAKAEAAVKKYRKGEHEKKHFHKIATEITVIASGEVEMNGKRYSEGDIIIIEPGEATDFKAITDSVTFVVKVPSAPNDKYFGG